LREHKSSFQDKGAQLTAVGLGDASYARAFQEETGIQFPLLIDERREAYRALQLKKANLLHIFWKLNSQSRKRARADGHRQHKLGKDPFQLGGSFVFGPGNVDRFTHISETFADNAPAEVLLKALL
jgi:hypothetical protein